VTGYAFLFNIMNFLKSSIVVVVVVAISIAARFLFGKLELI
jgi:hypothetical protein